MKKLSPNELDRVFNEDGNGTLAKLVIEYAKGKCEEQRELCAKEVEAGDGESDEFKREIKAMKELVTDAPEPEL